MYHRLIARAGVVERQSKTISFGWPLVAIVGFLFSLLVSAGQGAEVWDFPPLNTSYPLYSQLYSQVDVGNPVATGAYSEHEEPIYAVYAYLHPQSPYRYNAAYLARLKVLLAAQFSQWAGGQLDDDWSSFQCAYAYMLLKHHRPSDLTASEIASYETGLVNFCNDRLKNKLLYDDNILASLWLNGDIRIALAIHFAGVALNNTTYQTKAKQVLDEVMPQAVVGDGATHYVGFHNEVATYRSVSVAYMLWWYIISGSPEMKSALDKMIPYVPLSVEPGGFQEQSTAIAYKHYYNGLRGRMAALAAAYMSGDPYNYYFGQQLESKMTMEYALQLAALYRGPMTPLTPPTNFIVYDRAIMGPRGRWDDWAFVATGRNVQTPEPDHVDQGYESYMCGKNTFVGAMALGAWTNNSALRAALDGVCPEFKEKTGTTTDWARSTDGIYRFLSQDENTTTMARDTFGTLATAYRLSTRVSSVATPSWGAGTDWLGEQLWLMTEDRVVGLVQIHSEAADWVYGLDTRIVLTGGRAPILGAYHEVVEVASNQYDFGELSLRIGENNFGGTKTIKRIGVVDSAVDNYTALLRLHDSADAGNDTQIYYPAGTRRWAVIECIRDGRSFADSVNNVLEGDNNVADLEVRETDRRFRLIQNMTSSSRTYNTSFWGIDGATATLHRSWTNTVDVVTPQPGNAIDINVNLPAYSHVVVISGSDSGNHSTNQMYYDDIFTETVYPPTNRAPVAEAGEDLSVALSGSPEPWTPETVETEVWYDAADTATIMTNAGAVSQWDDKSGNKNHMTQGTASKRPILVGNYIEFDGVDDELDAVKIDPYNMTVFGVVQTYVNDAQTDANKSWLSQYGATKSNPDFWMTARAYSDQMGGYFSEVVGNSGSVAAAGRGADHIVAVYPFVNGGAAGKVRLDGGAAEGTIPALSETITAASDAALVLGRQKDNVARYHEGRVYEVVILPSRMTENAGDFLKIEGYLAHKWGLTNSLPVDHLYKSEAPKFVSATVDLAGMVSDPDDDPLTSRWLESTWSFVSGPAPVTFVDASVTNTAARFTVAGIYTLRLTANDGFDQASDDVVVTVTDGTSTNTSHGTPYSWLASFGITNNFEAADLADQDGDSVPTWQEYLAGTDPTDRTSVFRIISAIMQEPNLELIWYGTTNSGVMTDFVILRATNLISAPWIPISTNSRSANGTNIWMDPNPVGNALFYRIKIAP
jgi:hypothetical protein